MIDVTHIRARCNTRYMIGRADSRDDDIYLLIREIEQLEERIRLRKLLLRRLIRKLRHAKEVAIRFHATALGETIDIGFWRAFLGWQRMRRQGWRMP